MLLFCGQVVRGALAGNGEEMAAANQTLKRKRSSRKDLPVSSRKPESGLGSKTAARPHTKAQLEERVEASGAEEVCEDGAEQLRLAANRVVVENSDEIVEKLAEMAMKGNTSCAKILVELMATKKAPKKKRAGMTTAQRWMRDKQWEGPLEDGQSEIRESEAKPE